MSGGFYHILTRPDTTQGASDVQGPGSATDNGIVRYDGTTGKLTQDSLATVGDTGILAHAAGVGLTDSPILSQIEVMFKATGINLLATGQTLVVPALTSGSFLPTRAYIELITVTGVLTVPIIRLGNSVNFDNVAPLLTCTGLTTVRNILNIPLAAALVSISITSTGISLDIQTAGSVASVATANVYISGFLR